MPLKIFGDIANWAGALLSPASQQATSAPVCPDVRAAARKYCGVVYNGPLAANAPFTGPWIDTQQTGGIYLILNIFTTQAFAINNTILQGAEDPSNPFSVRSIITATTTNPNAVNTYGIVIPTRYWRALGTMGGTSATQVLYTYQELNFVPPLQNYTSNNGTGALTPALPSLVNANSGSLGADGGVLSGAVTNSAGSPSSIAVTPYLSTAASIGSGGGAVVQRTPNIFRGSQFSAAGQNIIWTPRVGFKIRLMKYKFEVSEDVTISGGPLPVNLAFTNLLNSGATTGASIANLLGPNYTHRFVAPSAVLATSGQLYESDWIDLGNGSLAPTANFPLAVGLMVPQTTGAITPTFTIASNQWEAATVGFKTNSNLGNFKLIQSTQGTSTSSVASQALVGMSTATGNAIFVFIRISKVVGGAPTITVTDTAGNTYTVTTQVANASDSANGSAICMAYSINATGNANNVITVNFGTNNAAANSIIAFEYAGLGSAGIDAAQVGTTGSSTSPSSGAYTPLTAGDLVFTFYGTAANVAAVPTIGSNFRLLNAFFAATSGSMSVADNFGNGALTAGQVNVICAGTEE